MVKLSYINLINDFWRFYDENNNELNVSDIAMYKVLLRYCNKINWINPFFVDPFLMSQINPLSTNTYYKSLDKLDKLGLISYEKGKHNVSKAKITILKIKNSLKSSVNNSVDNSIKFSVEDSIVNNNKTIIQSDDNTIKQLNIELSKKDEKINEQQKEIEKQAFLILELEEKLKKKKKKPEPLHTSCKNYFLDYYLENKKEKYYWTVKDSTNLNQIIKKIRAMEMAITENSVLLGFEKLISSIKDFDSWVFDNFEPAIINSKFNTLIEKIKSNKKESEKKKDSNEIDYSFVEEKMKRLYKDG